jgi:hypothetical protein
VLASVTAPTIAIGALVALLSSNGYGRSISLGLYAVGAFCVAGGFGVGTRSSLRRSSADPGAVRPRGRVGAEEIRATVATAGVLISVGLLLLVLGTIVDPRVRAV